jgi:hypothetical protein
LELHEVGLLVPQFGVFAAMAVAAQTGLAADHLRAKFTEHARDGGTGGAGGKLDYANAFKG